VDVRWWLRRTAAGVDPLVKDGGLAIALLGIASWELMGGQDVLVPARHLAPEPGLLPLAALMILPVAVRRRWPLLGWWASVAGWALTGLVANRFGLSLASAAALLVLAYSAGACSGLRKASLLSVLAGSLLAVGGLGLSAHQASLEGAVNQYSPAVIPFTLWLVGSSVRARTMRARRERESSLRAAVAEERGRIARELHDVVGHAVTVMIVQAEGARRLLTRRPDRAAEALLAISATGNDALAELRHLLAVLAGGGGREEVEPDAGLAWLEPLLERMRGLGMAVELQRRGEPWPLQRGLDLTAYRIIQEALTNVLKHVGPTRADVRLDYAPDHLAIEVADRGPARNVPGERAGRGLLGMRERVAAYGGELDAGPRPGGGFRVRALLPLDQDG
jgi:signal transduction histidine kinase